MRGGAQAHLLEADDGNHYVVKFLNNPQHRRILVNELLASCFLQYLQLSSPQYAIISVSPEFLAGNPDLCIQLGNQFTPVEPGWHFGSRFPGHPERQAVYDFLPDALLMRVSNLRHFAGALVFDKWLGNVDARQAIYFRARVSELSDSREASPPAAGFLAQMIDHGYAFGGPDWDFRDAPLDGLAPRGAVYAGLKSWDDFQPWLDQVTGFPEAVVDKALKQVPPQWLAGDDELLDDMMERLMRRRRRTGDLIDACRQARPGLFPDWK
jgi:hypothetical protein